MVSVIPALLIESNLGLALRILSYFNYTLARIQLLDLFLMSFVLCAMYNI